MKTTGKNRPNVQSKENSPAQHVVKIAPCRVNVQQPLELNKNIFLPNIWFHQMFDLEHQFLFTQEILEASALQGI